MSKDLVMVTLNEQQIIQAKEENGKRKQITHALVVGSHGVMFGTEKQCRKYYSTWSDIFSHLFHKCYESTDWQLRCFVDSGNVVMSLIAESDAIESEGSKIMESSKMGATDQRKKTLLSKIFRK